MWRTTKTEYGFFMRIIMHTSHTPFIPLCVFFSRRLSFLHANHAHTTISWQFIDSNALVLCAIDVVRSTLWYRYVRWWSMMPLIGVCTRTAHNLTLILVDHVHRSISCSLFPLFRCHHGLCLLNALLHFSFFPSFSIILGYFIVIEGLNV